MKKIIYILILVVSFFSCKTDIPTKFSDEALNDTFITLEGDSIPFKDILQAHEGKTIVIDVWASWCSDCIKGMPKVKVLQDDFKDVVYLFLSLDRSQESWKKGIEKYNVQGAHYFMQSGWKGPFGTFVELDWIPRYMIINPDGTIKVFKAIEADDNKLIEALK
ncbi:TlpA family protein disulfide reductase [Confluentibacter citreus]|uniref:TlpA family protein disulfide reductase n=1 Tax=Confluentibacter citreus TaxID=2007307 RepID=UPI000C2817DC|nr:thioredoxin family protein [Confluentibacter citreus]